MNFSRLQPTYVSLSIINNGLDATLPYSAITSPDGGINASIRQTFDNPIFKDSSQYVVAVERMELSINGIPFYVAEGELITVVERANPGNTTNVIVNTSAYSISQLFVILNALVFTSPIDASTFNIVFSLSKEGFVTMSLQGGKLFDTLYFIFPRKLNMILGISTAQQTTGTITSSTFSRLDLGDSLTHIILESNLQTTSDSIGNVPLQVLTDFAPPTAYSTSLTYGNSGALERSGASVNLRQKVIYNPSERRYLDLISSFNIQSINIDAYYSDLDENLRRVIIPLGGVFQIKLGFYKKG